jgi:hypothetical protein
MAVSRHIDKTGTVTTGQMTVTARAMRCSGSASRTSPRWLGHHAIPGQIRQSGLWNAEHATNPCHLDFLPTLEQLMQQRQ